MTNKQYLNLVPLALGFITFQPIKAEESTLNDDDKQDNVVVFRQQAPQNLSITALNSDDVETVQHQHIQQLLNRTPAVSMQRGSGQESLLAIRSPVFTGAGACGAFLVMEDDVPVRPAGFCNVNQLFETHSDLAAGIEIHAGPGLHLPGRTSPATKAVANGWQPT